MRLEYGAYSQPIRNRFAGFLSLVISSWSKKMSWKFRFLEFRIMPPLPIKSISYIASTTGLHPFLSPCKRCVSARRFWVVLRGFASHATFPDLSDNS
jgi:hypothetical protein